MSTTSSKYVPFDVEGRHQHLYYRAVHYIGDKYFSQYVFLEKDRAVKIWKEAAKAYYEYPGGWLEYETKMKGFGLMWVLELRCCPFKRVSARFQKENRVLVVV